MKKSSILPGCLGIVTLLCALSAFLFPLAPGLINAEGDIIYGYDLMFGNNAIQAFDTPVGAFIAVFVLTAISALFQLLATIIGWRGGKFSGFLHILSAMMLIASGVICFLAPSFITDAPFVSSLDWGMIGTAVSLLLGALISLVIGVLAFLKKKNA